MGVGVGEEWDGDVGVGDAGGNVLVGVEVGSMFGVLVAMGVFVYVGGTGVGSTTGVCVSVGVKIGVVVVEDGVIDGVSVGVDVAGMGVGVQVGVLVGVMGPGVGVAT